MRHVHPVRFAVVAVCLSACGHEPPDDTDRDVLSELTSPGPYAVGYHQGELTYADTVAGGDRTMHLAVWYPSSASTVGGVRYRGLIEADDVGEDAPEADGRWPLVVFSHGHQGYAENSGFLMAFLASHGFVVAAPDHTGNTFFDSPDRATEIYLQRPLDVSAVIDAMLARDDVDGDAPIVGIGHSFGGYTIVADDGAPYDVDGILASCEDGTGGSVCSTMTPAYADRLGQGFLDGRLARVVAMAPGDVDLFGDVAGVGAPVLLMSGDEDGGTPGGADVYWEQLAGGVHRRVSITGAGHQSFTDWADSLEDVTMDAADGWRIVDAYVYAWVLQAQGDDGVAPVLDGDLVVDDRAAIDR